MQKRFAAVASSFSACRIQFPFDAPLEEVLAHLPESPHPRFFISNPRTRFFRSAWSALKFRRYVFIRTFTPSPSAACTGRQLFDHAAVFHPGYEERFSKRRASRSVSCCRMPSDEICLKASSCRANSKSAGSVKPAVIFTKPARSGCQSSRREFRTNDWSRSYSIPEVANVYRRSKIVVNIGRDDFRRMRTYASSRCWRPAPACLPRCLRSSPQLGFQEGVHFVGYRDPSELTRWCASIWVMNRRRDANRRGRPRTLDFAEHTYDRRVDQLLTRLAKSGTGKSAPARCWPETRARLAGARFLRRARTPCIAPRCNFAVLRGTAFARQWGASLLSRSWVKSLRSK